MRDMRPILNAVFLVALAFGLVTLAAQSPTPSPPTQVAQLALSAQDNLWELRAGDDRVNALLRTNGLTLRTSRADTVLEGRVHERYDQYVGGVRVFGGDVARQIRAGLTESIFGSIYEGIDLDTTPSLSESDARLTFAKLSGTNPAAERAIELVVLPRDD